MNFVKARKSFFGIYNRFYYIFITLAACIVFLFLAKGIDSAFNVSIILIENNIFHRFLEIFILIISFSIFFVSYFTYPQTNDNRLLTISYIFLAGGLLFWIKVLGITNNSALYDSFLSCILIRFVNSVCFSISFTCKPKNEAKMRRIYLLLGATTFLLISVLLIKNPDVNIAEYVGLGRVLVQADARLDDGDLIHIGNLEFKILHTPGHTKGRNFNLFRIRKIAIFRRYII